MPLFLRKKDSFLNAFDLDIEKVSTLDECREKIEAAKREKRTALLLELSENTVLPYEVQTAFFDGLAEDDLEVFFLFHDFVPHSMPVLDDFLLFDAFSQRKFSDEKFVCCDRSFDVDLSYRMPPRNALPKELGERIKLMDVGFAETLFRLIDEKGMTDVECYKRAAVSRKTFSKIKCDPAYRPSKATALSFAVALRLSLSETENLLRTAGLSLSHSQIFDVVVEYYILHEDYDLFKINETLFALDQVCLGSLE